METDGWCYGTLTQLMRGGLNSESDVMVPELLLLPLQQAPANPACLTDFDSASVTLCFTNYNALLLSVDNAGLLVALRFQTCVVFVELFRCLSDYVEDPGGFGEFLHIAQKPAPAFDRCGIIQGFRSDLKMIQLQKVDLQIVSQYTKNRRCD